ncbi:hypothetical protein ABK040_006068 [Willaertia magna]
MMEHHHTVHYRVKETPHYVIDLNTKPRERWKPIIKDFLPLMEPLNSYLDKIAKEEVGGAAPLAMFFSSWFIKNILQTMSDDMIEELQGMAELTSGMGLTFERLLHLNIGYSLVAMCTAATVKEEDSISKKENNGIFHLRNLDWDYEISEAFRELTVDVDFVRGNELIFRTTTFVGMNGILTGMKYKTIKPQTSTSSTLLDDGVNNHHQSLDTCTGFSISLNYRKEHLGNEFIGILKNVLSGYIGFWPVEYLLRKVFEEANSMEMAIKYFEKNSIVAPCYLLICGENDSYLLTMNRMNDVNRKRLTREDISKQTKRKFIVQTNIDHWKHDFDKEWAGNDYLLHNALERKYSAESFLRNYNYNNQIFHESYTLNDLQKFTMEKTFLGKLNKSVNNHCVTYMKEEYFNFLLQCLSNYPNANRETVFQVICNPKTNFYFSRIIYSPPEDDKDNWSPAKTNLKQNQTLEQSQSLLGESEIFV